VYRASSTSVVTARSSDSRMARPSPCSCSARTPARSHGQLSTAGNTRRVSLRLVVTATPRPIHHEHLDLELDELGDDIRTVHGPSGNIWIWRLMQSTQFSPSICFASRISHPILAHTPESEHEANHPSYRKSLRSAHAALLSTSVPSSVPLST
jgi:hypothetical protein